MEAPSGFGPLTSSLPRTCTTYCATEPSCDFFVSGVANHLLYAEHATLPGWLLNEPELCTTPNESTPSRFLCF